MASSLPERAERVAALASEHAEFADREGRLAEPVVEALHREGLFGMWVPRTLGGAELDAADRCRSSRTSPTATRPPAGSHGRIARDRHRRGVLGDGRSRSFSAASGCR